jgi:methylmalonyl-CoA/ethylmalonyl-CoA epimerase
VAAVTTRTLDHVAIAVADLPEAIRRFAEDFGLPFEGEERVASAETHTAFFPVSTAARTTHVELVAPLDGGGPIARSLASRGPGLHHLCFRTDDLAGDIARLRERGYRFTTEAPTAGAHGTTVIFVHPKSTGGVLIELVEYPVGKPHVG